MKSSSVRFEQGAKTATHSVSGPAGAECLPAVEVPTRQTLAGPHQSVAGKLPTSRVPFLTAASRQFHRPTNNFVIKRANFCGEFF